MPHRTPYTLRRGPPQAVMSAPPTTTPTADTVLMIPSVVGLSLVRARIIGVHSVMHTDPIRFDAKKLSCSKNRGRRATM